MSLLNSHYYQYSNVQVTCTNIKSLTRSTFNKIYFSQEKIGVFFIIVFYLKVKTATRWFTTVNFISENIQHKLWEPIREGFLAMFWKLYASEKLQLIVITVFDWLCHIHLEYYQFLWYGNFGSHLHETTDVLFFSQLFFQTFNMYWFYLRGWNIFWKQAMKKL